MTYGDDLREAVQKVAEVAGAAVVAVGRGHDGSSRGAGVVTGEGLVLTSAHNLRGEAVTLTFPGGRTEMAEVKGVDIEGDLAVVAADTTGAVPLSWSSAEVALGQAVFALGARRAGTGVRVTAGHVSALGTAFRGPRGRLITEGFEHTAAVGRGSSGGPVVDAGGALLGINTHRPFEGLYLAIPATADLRRRVDALAHGETPQRRRLGVALAPAHAARRLREAVGLAPRDGMLVREIEESGPAASAGIQRGDLIVAVAGLPVATLDALVAALDGAPGPVVAVSVVRGNDELSFEVRFEVSPQAPGPAVG